MRYWDEIDCGRLDFKYREKSAAAISLITKEALLEFYNTYISPSSSSRSQLAIFLRSQRIQAEELLPLSNELASIFTEPHLGECIILMTSKPTVEQIKNFVESTKIILPPSIEKLMLELELKSKLPDGVVEIEDIESFKLGLKQAERVLPIDDYRTDLLVENLSHL